MTFYAVFLLILAIFGAVNYYIGRRGWQWLSSMAPHSVSRPVYWTAFWLLALSFLFARLAPSWLPMLLTDLITLISSYWLAVFVYALLLLILIDLLRLLNR